MVLDYTCTESVEAGLLIDRFIQKAGLFVLSQPFSFGVVCGRINKKYQGGGFMKVAAIQLNAEFANVAANLQQAEKAISAAAQQGAKIVVLPEFFTSAIGFAPQMLTVAAQNAPVTGWMAEMAARYQCMLGGSYLIFDGAHAYNLFTLALPDGQTFQHKKDLPTQFENCYYTKGDTIHVLSTPIGPVGVALCWEMIRYDTVKRLKGKVQFVLAGSCWWDLPIDAPPEKLPLRQYNQSFAWNTPSTFAKLLGVPVIHANHCGRVTAFRFPAGDAQQTRQLVGAAQIVNGDGTVLARKGFEQGSGVITAEISPAVVQLSHPLEQLPAHYWIPDLPPSYLHAWQTLNVQGQAYYETTARPYYKKHDTK